MMGPPVRLVAACASLVTAFAGPHSVHAQRAQGAVLPQTITVGDIFHAALRVDLPPGASVIAPDSLPLPEDLEAAGSREIRVDTAGGLPRATILYPLAAWRTGSYQLDPVTVQVIGNDASMAMLVSLPEFTVSSVLPADTAGVQPQPAKDVLGANRLWWPLLLALLLAAVVATAVYLWWRRRAKPEPLPAAVPMVLPRAAALQRLAEIEAAGYIENGDMKPFYEQLTETLRRYAATARPEWSVDLTTSELAEQARYAASASDAAECSELLRILAGADLIKFARGRAARDEARYDLNAARAWIERVDSAESEPASASAGSDERRVA
jgi:hypothetical protein